MINKLFPFKLYLHIFQLDEYSVLKLMTWVFSHFMVRSTKNKKPLVWTQKVTLLYAISGLLWLLFSLLFIFSFHFLGFLFALFIGTQAYIFIALGYYLLLPIEIYNKHQIISKTKNKMQSLSHVKVIGITGSYGKTSVKEFLYQILKTEFRVLRTPESYNTPFGIAKVVNLELNNTYDYFVCEMGAYKRGEIKQICDMVSPLYGILTGINEQHLESFGSLENTTLGKFELIDALPTNSFGVINTDNKRIENHGKKYSKLFGYGFNNETFSIKNITSNAKGTDFSLILDGKAYQAYTKLIGTPNIQNILGAATMAYKLGMKPAAIISAIAKISPVSHRLEIKEKENMILIDNAYNSNVDGFKESIILLQTFENPKVFVTPGIVDLGKDTYEIHKELGKLLQNIDMIILVGNSQRTNGLYDGLNDKKSCIRVNGLENVWEEINKSKLIQPVVLLENDLPDNY